MNNLRKLNVGEFCGIDQNSIRGLNLIELEKRYNPKIIDIIKFH